MNWEEIVTELERRVPAGSVTTYTQVSLWGYGKPNLNQPVRSLLRDAVSHGHQRLTNRVVRTDGRPAELPEGSDQQKRQLLAEGVPFTTEGRVDLGRISPLTLG